MISLWASEWPASAAKKSDRIRCTTSSRGGPIQPKHQASQRPKKPMILRVRARVRNRTSKSTYLLPVLLLLLSVLAYEPSQGQELQLATGKLVKLGANGRELPDLVSGTSDEPVVAIAGQDAFLSCVAKNLQNYTIIWRFSNEAAAASESATSPNNDDKTQMITAGKQRVIGDDRFSVIQSHDTWLLKISQAKLSDTGTYICHTNSEPRVRALRILSVVRPNTSSGDEASEQLTETRLAEVDYKFNDCCRAEYVVPRCQRLCSLQQLASKYQSISIVHECYSSLPSITRCMVSGRNVTDCCQKRHLPQRCNAMCGHLGDTSAMSVQDQSFCADYSATIMSCAAEGISTLPGQPELVVVEAVSPSTLKVSWQKVGDEQELRKLDGWVINLTKLSSFEDTITPPSSQETPTSNLTTAVAPLSIVDVVQNSSLAAMTRLLAASSGSSVQLKLGKELSEFSIDQLKPYTVYQIQMFAYNSRGRSQLTEPIRALTLAPEADSSLASTSSSSGGSPEEEEVYVEPQLPDTRKCCLDKGVTLKRCLDTLCDPVEADRATIADLMICAPWSNVTFSCLSSRQNHTYCCKSRGVSPFCLSMCSGDVKRVDYRHFRCLTHMSTYTSCILESHNVLPSAPQNFTVGPITHSWAVLNWRAPQKHARSLHGYRIFWRRVEPLSNNSTSVLGRPPRLEGDPTSSSPATTNDEFLYNSAEAATNPYLLDALQPETVYETFVVAVNRYGQSDSSVRFIFQTLADPRHLKSSTQLSINQQQQQYNETACCIAGGVHSDCHQLCRYDMKVEDTGRLVGSCQSQLPVILRCLAGARNSVPCCRNRQVSDHCLNVCAGLTEHSPLVVATRCAPDFGKIIRCMDEGSRQIPGAPQDLHTADIKPDRVWLKWKPAPEDALRSDLEYHVRYQQLQQASDQPSLGPQDLSALVAVVPLHPLEHNLILSTNRTEAALDKLRPGARYSLYVTAENAYGISLPSLVLVLQTPLKEETTAAGESGGDLDNYKRRATLGAPHSLEVLRADTDSLVLKWIAPLFTTSDAQLKYRLFYKLLAPPANQSSSSSGDQEGDGQVQRLATNWTVVETAETGAVLRQLQYSSQYAITVQAFSRQLLGHMSEILLASTAKPVPPTLNQPLVINQPIEGNNITIMCVALGQPTPQISMFINGLLVQKRTQPYVIYHLVNLARGHLTITCFASNGRGKDYASVQSRTELSVKFAAKASVKQSQVSISSLQSSARLTCEVAGNPQPTVVWTYLGSPGSADTKGSIITPNERITTLLVSQFETPHTWWHTLTIRNVSQADLGHYQCRARNLLAESSDSVLLSLTPTGSLIEPSSSENTSLAQTAPTSAKLAQLELQSDLMQCCKAQNVTAKCLPVCSPDGLNVEQAFSTPECQTNLDKLMFCAADGSDHRACCRNRQVPASCLRWCSGAKLNIPALCFLSSALDIVQCFQEGRQLLPGPPRNLRAILASDKEEASQAQAQTATTTMMMSPNMMGLAGSGPNQINPTGSSVISSMVMMMGDSHSSSSSSSTEETLSDPSSAKHNEPQSTAEPIIIEWDAPAKNPQLVQYYRIFWRPLQSRELSRTVTNLTWIKLDALNTNRQYEFVVKAANTHGSSVYSDPLNVKPADIILAHSASSNGPAGVMWFMPSVGSGSSSLMGRVMMAITFATLFMFGSLALVMLLERKGYLKRFASSKTNSSRISFANPAYLKDADGNPATTSDTDRITWDSGHSLDILGTPPESNDLTNNGSSETT